VSTEAQSFVSGSAAEQISEHKTVLVSKAEYGDTFEHGENVLNHTLVEFLIVMEPRVRTSGKISQTKKKKKTQ